MKPKIIFLFCFAMPLFCMAQTPLSCGYQYDATGNRTSCKVIPLSPPQAPPAPPTSPVSPVEDSLAVLEDLGAPAPLLSSDLPISDLPISEFSETNEDLESPTSLSSSDLSISDFLVPEYFVEKIAQVEIKIYPNPATEKITLAISEWGNLQTGTFKLYTLNGQLLQEQAVHSASTTVSLAGFSKGAYILKVHINGITEDWKIIKQ